MGRKNDMHGDVKIGGEVPQGNDNEESIEIYHLVTRDGVSYNRYTKKPFTGKTTERSKWNYKDGIRQGEQLDYYANGILHVNANYKDGKRDGKQFNYSENGQLLQTEIWKDDELIEIIDH